MEMDNNNIVLEFLEVLSKEPVLWNSKHYNCKNRPLVAAAWQRVQNALSEHHTIDSLKRKKNSLLTQYRQYLRKIRDSSLNSNQPEQVYKPSWFAFDVMHEFLGPIYQNRPSFNTEVFLLPDVNDDEKDDNYKTDSTKWPPIREKKVQKQEDDDSTMDSESNSANEEPLSPQSPSSPPAIIIKKKLSPKDRNKRPAPNRENTPNTSSDDECDLYGKLIAMKLKRLDHEDRLRLINDIDNLVYKHMMSMKTRNRSSSSTL